MNMTEEKAGKILDYLKENEERTAELIKMTAEEAAEKMTADGCAVTAEEFSELISMADNRSEELDEDTLEDVAGGNSYLLAGRLIFEIGGLINRCRQRHSW